MNTAGTNSFIEYYLLQSLHAQTMQPTTPAHWHLTDNVAQALNLYSAELATSIRDYILISASGEARYAYNLAYPYYIEEIENNHYSRNRCYTDATKFDPLTLAQALTEIFNQKWSGSAYGGHNWRDCTQTALDYMRRKYDDILFVDRAADLHHNGGTLFSKYTPYFRIDNLNLFVNFLDYKARTLNFAEDYITGKFTFRVKITSTTANLLNQYSRLILGKDVDLYGLGKIEPMMFEHPTWEDAIPTIIDRSSFNSHPHHINHHRRVQCEQCGEYFNQNYESHDTGGYRYCPDCAGEYCTCYECGRLITDDYSAELINGDYYCEECAEYFDHCPQCGNASKDVNYQTWDNQYICYDCYCRFYQCESCNLTITNTDDAYITEDNYTYCPDCYEDYTFECHGCRQTYSLFQDHTRYNEHLYCESCADSLDFDTCPICGIFDYHHRISPIIDPVYICDECKAQADAIQNQLQLTLNI